MSSQEMEAVEDLFAALLAAYDDALAAGSGPTCDAAATLLPAVLHRLQQAQACLLRLEREWPRVVTDARPA